ncbi:MAG: carboxypeptidase regulatory-like domain-containing protein [Flavobacteriaceae bacterium]
MNLILRNKATLFVGHMVLALILLIGCEKDTIDDSDLGHLEGTIVAKGANTPLRNAKISTNPSSNTVFTNDEGYFLLEDVPVGKYSVQADHPDYKTGFKSATVTVGNTVNVVMELDSVNAANKAPTIPKLLSPEDGAEGVARETKFIWSSSTSDDDDVFYTLELRQGNSNEINTLEKIKDTFAIIDDLAIGVHYFWQITATDEINEPVKSALGSFRVIDNTQNRFLYVREMEGNHVIISGDEPLNGDTINQNEVLLSSGDHDSYRPVKNQTVGKIAFLRNTASQAHIFLMDTNGSNATQLTGAIPMAGFRNDQLQFAWYNNGKSIYYPNFGRLYSIDIDKSGNSLVYTAPEGQFISRVAVNQVNDHIAILTNDARGYKARLVVIDSNTGEEVKVVLESILGAVDGIDFSSDGKRILFSRDVSGSEFDNYRRLDSRLFEYDLESEITRELKTEKESGMNDLDPRYAPDEANVIFVRTSNDGISEKNIYRIDIDFEDSRSPELLFSNASMPNWE